MRAGFRRQEIDDGVGFKPLQEGFCFQLCMATHEFGWDVDSVGIKILDTLVSSEMT